MRVFAGLCITGCNSLQVEVTGETLSTFLPDAIELARQGEAAHHSMPSQQLQSMQSAFWLARQLRIVLEGCVKSAPPQARVQLLEALARAIDSSGNDALSKCTVVIGEGAGMDILGRIWLPYDLPQVCCSSCMFLSRTVHTTVRTLHTV